MKKVLFMAFVAIFMTTNAVKAEEVATVANEICYTVNINSHSLSRYLNLNCQQAETMEFASDKLYNSIKCLKKTEATKRPARLRTALNQNLALVKMTLDENQYREYLNVLNHTLNNKGLSSLLNEDYTAVR